MLFTRTAFLGIEPSSGRRPLAFAALDDDLNLLALGLGSRDAVLAYAAGLDSAIVAVNGPRRAAQGWLAREEFRASLQPVPKPGRWDGWRVAEYEIRLRGIKAARTAYAGEAAGGAMGVFGALDQLGFTGFPAAPSTIPEGARFSIEVYPHGAFTALLGRVPFPRNSLEGRIQRQLVLYINQVNVPNPMSVFEEITRHRLLQGILPLEMLHTPAELDALVGAFTARFAARTPDAVRLGHPAEGEIVFPVRQLPAHFS